MNPSSQNSSSRGRKSQDEKECGAEKKKRSELSTPAHSRWDEGKRKRRKGRKEGGKERRRKGRKKEKEVRKEGVLKKTRKKTVICFVATSLLIHVPPFWRGLVIWSYRPCLHSPASL